MRVDPPLLMPPSRPLGTMPVASAEAGATRSDRAAPALDRAGPPNAVTDRLPTASLAALRLADPRREPPVGEGAPQRSALRALRDIGALDGSELVIRGGRIDVTV